MTRIPLTGGAYQARSVVASAQRCVNLYPESNPQDSQAPVPVTHYPTPGTKLITRLPTIATMRGIYRATDGNLYAVVGSNVYYVDVNYSVTLVGSISFGLTPVSFSDNGLVIVIVDGTASGYAIKMSDRTFGSITSAAFYGADKVDFLDTYFVFNKPGTQQFYISLSNVDYAMLTGGTAFDSLDIAAKSGSGDALVSLYVVHRELWLIGALTTEVWVNTGKADFTFEALPGLDEHGCVAKYSVAQRDTALFWLSRDRQGQGIVVQTEGYRTKRISTHAIEAEIQAYTRIDDAIGFCYQQQGHAFYALTFPSADVTWCYELASGQWHQWAYTDQNGNLRRHRANCSAFAYGQNLVGDWQNGSLYALDPNVFTDNGNPIVRIRSFPHLIKDGNRVSYLSFIADMQVGTLGGTMPADAPNVTPLTTAPLVSLRWSDTRGASYGNALQQSLGAAGEYLISVQWNRLGMARDRVFELSWSAPVRSALNGAFVDIQEHAT
jgi:hypothetical protein